MCRVRSLRTDVSETLCALDHAGPPEGNSGPDDYCLGPTSRLPFRTSPSYRRLGSDSFVVVLSGSPALFRLRDHPESGGLWWTDVILSRGQTCPLPDPGGGPTPRAPGLRSAPEVGLRTHPLPEGSVLVRPTLLFRCTPASCHVRFGSGSLVRSTPTSLVGPCVSPCSTVGSVPRVGPGASYRNASLARGTREVGVSVGVWDEREVRGRSSTPEWRKGRG